jgi:hypothetical protein
MTSAYSFWANRSVRYSRTNRHFLHRYLRDNNRHSDPPGGDVRSAVLLCIDADHPSRARQIDPQGEKSVRARGIDVIVDLAEQSDVEPAARRARAVLIAELYFAARQAPGDKAADLGVGDPAARSFQGGNRLNRDFLSHLPLLPRVPPCNTVHPTMRAARVVCRALRIRCWHS